MTVNIIDKEQQPLTLNDIYQCWYKLKTRYSDALVLVRSGDNYFAFEQDAVVIVGLMQREPLPLWKDREVCILPYHYIDESLGKVVKEGYRAAICEPMSIFNLY